MVAPMVQDETRAASCPECARIRKILKQRGDDLAADLVATLDDVAAHRKEHDRLLTELAQVKAARDELQVQVTEWELTAAREGLLCRGDIEQ